MRTLAIIALLFFTGCTSDTPTDQHPADSLRDTLPHDTTAGKVDTTGGSQVKTCSILGRPIAKLDNKAAIDRDLAELVNCGVDSFDYVYVVPNLFPGFAGEKQVQGDKNVTYGDFVRHLEEFKQSPAYTQLHQRVTTLDSLRSTKYDATKVYYMKPVLGKLGFTEPEWEMFLGFSRTYPVPTKGVFTWGDMLDEFEKYNSKVPN